MSVLFLGKYLSRNPLAINSLLWHKIPQLPTVPMVQVCDPWKERKENLMEKHSEQLPFFLSPQLFKQMLGLSTWDRHTRIGLDMSVGCKFRLIWICAPHRQIIACAPWLCTQPICWYDTYSYLSTEYTWVLFLVCSLSFSLPISLFHAHKCTTILKLLHGVMGAWSGTGREITDIV